LDRIKEERTAFVKAKLQRKKKDKPMSNKIYKMAEELKSILTILKESKAPVSSKTLWQSSVHKDDIDEFYAELKKHIEKGEVIELPREGKESFLQLREA
jgi:type I restriction enzyme S subunit